jgi:hypothetical protein
VDDRGRTVDDVDGRGRAYDVDGRGFQAVPYENIG